MHARRLAGLEAEPDAKARGIAELHHRRAHRHHVAAGHG
jgi:hypothetical protein